MSDSMYGLEQTVAALTAENERLRAEISAGEVSVCGVIGGLEAEIELLKARIVSLADSCASYAAENERLLALDKTAATEEKS